MKKVLQKSSFLCFLFLFLSYFSVDAQTINETINGCCVSFLVTFNDTGNPWEFHPDCPIGSPCPNDGNGQSGPSAPPNGTMTFMHCYDGPGTYYAAIKQLDSNGRHTVTRRIILEDCETTDCWTNEVVSPEGCMLGNYTLCCDGSLTMNGTQNITFAKIFNAPGCPLPNGCILCGHWSMPPCNTGANTFTFPAGTVTATNNVFIEFQSTSPWDDFDCEWNSGAINLSDQIAERCEEGAYVDGRSRKANKLVNDVSFSITPNPASDHVRLSTNSSSIREVNIYDLNGRLYCSSEEQGLQSIIDLSHLSQGTYILRILDLDSEQLHTERISILK